MSKCPIHTTSGRLFFGFLAVAFTGAATVGLFSYLENGKVPPADTSSTASADTRGP